MCLSPLNGPRFNCTNLLLLPPHFPSLPPPSLPPQPPVVKTEMVTISDTFAAQKTEIATKEVPIVHTETKTITYEAAQVLTEGDCVHFLLFCVCLVLF